MLNDSGVTTQQLFDLFSGEIETQGGRITDTYLEERRLFTRSILPPDEEVRPGDHVNGGVALKATSTTVFVYPYVFRQVCKNGAIMAQTVGSRIVEQIDEQEPEAVLEAVREAVQVCCDPEIFQQNVRRMRTSAERQADITLQIMSIFSELKGSVNIELMERIVGQFFQDGDRTQFGLANAITAVARETPDPDTKWDLEELGGGIAIGLPTDTPLDDIHAATANMEWAVAGR